MTQCEFLQRAKTYGKSEYAQRIDGVIDYLRANLHRPVRLAELANVACFSEFPLPSDRLGQISGCFSQGFFSEDDPHVTPMHLYRYDARLASSSPFECMEELTMQAMRYAVIKVSGDIHKVATVWDYVYRDWLINSAYEPEHAPALEIFQDRESAWSHFELQLCLPVRKPAEMTNGSSV